MGADKVFTLEDVSKHNTNKDCWLIICGKGCKQDKMACELASSSQLGLELVKDARRPKM